MDRSVFYELVGPTVAFLEDRTRSIDPAFCLDDLVESTWNVSADTRIPLVRTHGDFLAGNLLVFPLGELIGVPGWETSTKYAWPLLDLLNLIAFNRKWYVNNYFYATVTRKLAPRRFAPWERSMIDGYTSLLGYRRQSMPRFRCAILDDPWSVEFAVLLREMGKEESSPASPANSQHSALWRKYTSE